MILIDKIMGDDDGWRMNLEGDHGEKLGGENFMISKDRLSYEKTSS